MTINVPGMGRVALPPYRCQVVEGQHICVPPLQAAGGDVVASAEIGATGGAFTGRTLRSSLPGGPLLVFGGAALVVRRAAQVPSSVWAYGVLCQGWGGVGESCSRF